LVLGLDPYSDDDNEKDDSRRRCLFGVAASFGRCCSSDQRPGCRNALSL
jgi:hypothetical protein